MKSYVSIFLLFCLLFSCVEKQKPKVLVFSKTKGYRHESIGVGKLTLIELGEKNGFEVDTTENSDFFNEDSLKRYRAVIFLSTTMDVLDPVQQADFKRFIEAGGGFLGIHAAADTEYEWPWYGDLLGAYFKSHPKTAAANALPPPIISNTFIGNRSAAFFPLKVKASSTKATNRTAMGK